MAATPPGIWITRIFGLMQTLFGLELRSGLIFPVLFAVTSSWCTGGALCCAAKNGFWGDFLKYSEIQKMSLMFTNSSSELQKIMILQKVWDIEGPVGLLVLSKSLGYSYEYLYVKGDIDAVRTRKNKLRRGRRCNQYRKKIIISNNDNTIAEVAKEAALGGFEHNCGGKKTGHVNSNGSVKSISSAQSMQALLGQ